MARSQMSAIDPLAVWFVTRHRETTASKLWMSMKITPEVHFWPKIDLLALMHVTARSEERETYQWRTKRLLPYKRSGCSLEPYTLQSPSR